MSLYIPTANQARLTTAFRGSMEQPGRSGLNTLAFVRLICFLAAVAVWIGGASAARDFQPGVIIWTTALVLLALPLYGFWLCRRSTDNPWFSPLYFAAAFYFFKYGWGALVAYYWSSIHWQVYPQLRDYFYRFGVWNNLPATCRLFLLGGLGFFIGLSLPTGFIAARLSRLRWPVSEAKLKLSVLLFTPIVVIAFWLVSSRTLDAGVPFYVVAVSSVADGLTILIAYYAFSAASRIEQVKWLLFLVVISLLRMPAALSTGQLVPILTPALMTLFGYVIARGNPPWRWMAVSVPLLVFFILPFATLYKFAETEGGPWDKIEIAKERFATTTYEARLELSLTRTLARFCGAQFPAVFSQFYPNVYPFQNGRTFGTELTGFVPRILWPDKPEISPELNRYSEQVGLVRADSGTSMVFDAVSEYYLNFGAAGVFAMFVLHGWYLAALYDWLVRRGHQLIGYAIFLCLLPGNWDLFGLVNQSMLHVKVVPVWLVLYYFMSRKSI